MSVQPAKLAPPIRLLCEKLPKVYVFSAHTILTTFCAPFLCFLCPFSRLFVTFVNQPPKHLNQPIYENIWLDKLNATININKMLLPSIK